MRAIQSQNQGSASAAAVRHSDADFAKTVSKFWREPGPDFNIHPFPQKTWSHAVQMCKVLRIETRDAPRDDQDPLIVKLWLSRFTAV